MPVIYEMLLVEDPASIMKYEDAVTYLQWAIGYWFHSDVAVIEEVIRCGGSHRFSVVLEDYVTRNGAPWMRTTRVDITPRELLGMYRYYKNAVAV